MDVLAKACTSFGKQLPPYPIPANRKRLPIRESVPIPLRTSSTFAPTSSHRLAISFMNVILVAKNALAAYFVSSAERSSIKMIGLPWRTKGAYKRDIKSFARSDCVPITTRSGFIKSSTATPSRKNSGLETTSKSTFACLAIAECTFSDVPTGTVLLSMITAYSDRSGPKSSATCKMYFKSAEPSAPGGVGRARKMTFAPAIPSCKEVVKSRRPSSVFLLNKSSKPGS